MYCTVCVCACVSMCACERVTVLFTSSATVSWLPQGCTSGEDYGGSAGFRTNCCSTLFHASMWGEIRTHTRTCTHKHVQPSKAELLGSAPFSSNSDAMFLSAWQMHWPTFTGKPWRISLPHNPPLPTWILDSLFFSPSSSLFFLSAAYV